MAVDHRAFARAASKRVKLAKTLRARKAVSDDGFEVVNERGARQAYGFDTEAEAQGWIDEQS